MTPIATHMYQGLPFKIYRNIKCDTGLGDASHSNYSIPAAGDPMGRCKRKEREKLSPFGGCRKPAGAVRLGASGVSGGCLVDVS